jgi:hypothetical protein
VLCAWSRSDGREFPALELQAAGPRRADRALGVFGAGCGARDCSPPIAPASLLNNHKAIERGYLLHSSRCFSCVHAQAVCGSDGQVNLVLQQWNGKLFRETGKQLKGKLCYNIVCNIYTAWFGKKIMHGDKNNIDSIFVVIN